MNSGTVDILDHTIPANLDSATHLSPTVPPAQGRIDGYDVARAFAVLGMIVVNFHCILLDGHKNPAWFINAANFMYGRAAALFVMLAGVGLSLMARRAISACDANALWCVRKRLIKRSIVLFFMGFLLTRFWAADILHFYGIFLLAGAYLLSASKRRLWVIMMLVLAFSTVLFLLGDGYPTLKSFLSRGAFFTDVFDDLFLNGYYPAFPWLIFFLLGLWLGRDEIISAPAVKMKVFVLALIAFVVAEVLAHNVPSFYIRGLSPPQGNFLDTLLFSNVFPVSPLFSVSAAAGSILVILTALSLSKFHFFSRLLEPLKSIGKLSLTIYIFHIFIGLAVGKYLLTIDIGDMYATLAVSFTFLFLILMFYCANLCRRHNIAGPFEWLLRRFSR